MIILPLKGSNSLVNYQVYKTVKLSILLIYSQKLQYSFGWYAHLLYFYSLVVIFFQGISKKKVGSHCPQPRSSPTRNTPEAR